MGQGGRKKGSYERQKEKEKEQGSKTKKEKV